MIKTSIPPNIIIKKEKIRDWVEKLLLPNTKDVNWDVLKTEFDYLEFTDSSIFILYKNNKPIGQFIETNFNNTISISHFIVVNEERHQGYGNLLLEEFYNSHKNRRICCTSVPNMCELYDKKLNMKKIKKSFNCNLEFDRKNIETIYEIENVMELKFSQENLNNMNEFLIKTSL